MPKFQEMRKITGWLFSMSAAAMYILLFAIAIAVATFIENDFGTPAAQKIVFHARWFEGLMLLFGLSILVNMVQKRLIQRRKYAVFLFHMAILIILIGAAVTRYWGEEGMLPIREGASNDQLVSSETYITGRVINGDAQKMWSDRVLFAGIGSNRYERHIEIADKSLHIELDSFYPDAIEEVVAADPAMGTPILTIVTAGPNGRIQHLLSLGDTLVFGGLPLAFTSGPRKDGQDPGVFLERDTLWMYTPERSTVMNMTTREVDTLPADAHHVLRMRSLYRLRGQSIVFKDYTPHGMRVPRSRSLKMRPEHSDALKLTLKSGEHQKSVNLWGALGVLPEMRTIHWEGMTIALGYGSKQIPLPFEVFLKDFQLERYPGSHSPSSYASEVEVIDRERGRRFDYRIYMNHVLDYRGYRLFQSSFDPDEQGTVLSVNRDWWGTGISYLGYFLLALGMLLSLFSRTSRFHKVKRNIAQLQQRRRSLMTVAGLVVGINILGGQLSDSLSPVPRSHAELFGRLLVQDPKGRIEPLNTLSSEVVRKVMGKNGWQGQNTDQILAGMLCWPEVWQRMPIVKIGHPGLAALLGINEGERAAFSDFYDADGNYKLKAVMEEALSKGDARRSVLEREIIKADERFNVLYMAFAGEVLRVFPKEGDPDHRWYNPTEAYRMDFGDANVLTQHFLQYYIGRARLAMKQGDWTEADFAVKGLMTYQDRAGKEVVPSAAKREIEIAYNKVNVFGWLILVYFCVGIALLLLAFYDLFRPGRIPQWFFLPLSGLVVLAFAAHTLGLGVRWYLSGHAPWSNGYESMIYIGWAVVLSGLFYIRKSPVALAATSILAGVVLGVAGMNWLNPEITPLVPVLKSYWLSIHVSIIVSSYGFFALGAIVGLINLLLYILRTRSNAKRVTLTIKELSNIAEATMTIGLTLLSIGTFLGGVWANESWGRYWGWDSKETWALVSILVYAFVLHMRMIPGLKDMYSFNLASVLAFSSILMTYFGVNYYLSGLHSYAAGDPIPIPVWVYYAVSAVTGIALAAYFKASTNERHG